jgi:hypothetical protein
MVAWRASTTDRPEPFAGRRNARPPCTIARAPAATVPTRGGCTGAGHTLRGVVCVSVGERNPSAAPMKIPVGFSNIDGSLMLSVGPCADVKPIHKSQAGP